VFKGTGDGAPVEFRSVVDAVRCAIEVQSALVERNAGAPLDRRIEFRIGIHCLYEPVGSVVNQGAGGRYESKPPSLNTAPSPTQAQYEAYAFCHGDRDAVGRSRMPP